MAVEEPLGRVIRRRRFESAVFKAAMVQNFIPFHVDNLSRGDPKTRAKFRFIQLWYTRGLDMSIEQVRAFMHLVDIHELEGFSMEPISRQPTNDVIMEDYKDGNDEGSEENKESEEAWCDHSAAVGDDNTTHDDFESIMRPENILADMGFKTREDFESYLGDQSTSHLPDNVVAPSNPQGAQDHQENPATPEIYDQNGFYIEEYGDKMDIDEPEEVPPAVVEPQKSTSWADEVHEASEAGLLQPPSSVSDLSGCPSLEESPYTSERSPSPESETVYAPLSDTLRNLLEHLGMNTNVARTNNVVTLTPEELEDLNGNWYYRMRQTEKAEKNRGEVHEESAEEADLLDTFDEESGMFYWQKEGLFLCRLGEFVYRNSLEPVRRLWWVEKKLPPGYERRKKPFPGSPLRNEVFM